MNLYNKTIAQEEFIFTPQNIDLVSEKIAEYIDNLGLEKSVKLQTRLLAERELLEYMDILPADSRFRLVFYKEFGKHHVSLEIPGEQHECQKEIEETFYHKLINSLDESKMQFSYAYEENVNIVDYKLPKKKKGTVFYSLFAIVLSIITYFVCLFLPDELTKPFLINIINPLQDLYIKILGMVSVVMILLAIISGICSIGDINTFKKEGAIIFMQFIGRVFIDSIVCTIIIAVFFPFLNLKFSFDFELLEVIYNNLLNLIPTNIVKPFLEGNTIQILVLGIGIGIILLYNIRNSTDLINAIEEFNINIFKAVSKICSYLPLLVYLSITSILLEGEFEAVLQAWKIIVMMMGIGVFRIIWLNIYLGFRLKKSWIKLIKNNLKITAMAFLTGSSSACIDLIMDLCEKEYGISRKESGFCFPLFHSFYTLDGVTLFTVFIYVMCAVYGVKQDFSVVVLNCIIFTIMSFAGGPFPSGYLPILITLLKSAGLPVELVAIYTSLSVLIEMIATGSRTAFVTSEIALIHKKTLPVDSEKLQ